MLNWTQCLRIIVLLAIAGFALVVSGLWKIITLLVIGAFALWLWTKWR